MLCIYIDYHNPPYVYISDEPMIMPNNCLKSSTGLDFGDSPPIRASFEEILVVKDVFSPLDSALGGVFGESICLKLRIALPSARLHVLPSLQALPSQTPKEP